MFNSLPFFGKGSRLLRFKNALTSFASIRSVLPPSERITGTSQKLWFSQTVHQISLFKYDFLGTIRDAKLHGPPHIRVLLGDRKTADTERPHVKRRWKH